MDDVDSSRITGWRDERDSSFVKRIGGVTWVEAGLAIHVWGLAAHDFIESLVGVVKGPTRAA
jgi:hypothetical protein